MNIFDAFFGKLLMMSLIPVIIIFILGDKKDLKTFIKFFFIAFGFTLFYRVFTIL